MESSFDRVTALEVLKDLSRCMYPSKDIFGCGTLVISRAAFEEVRKKYLDGKKIDNSNPKEYDDDDPFRGLR